MLRTLRNLIVNIMAAFIRDRDERHKFRNKYKIRSKFRKLRDDNRRLFNENKRLFNENREIKIEISKLKSHIDKRLSGFMNSFYDLNDLKYSNHDLKLLQQVNIILLKKFKAICEKNDIEFWLDWGTLLGAVRHKGYIPWDDDLDVGMTRSNFIKFEKAIVKEKDVTFQYQYSVYSVGHKIGKVFLNDVDTKVFLVFLDIFVYDFFDFDDVSDFQSHYKTTRDIASAELRSLRNTQDLKLGQGICIAPDDEKTPILEEPFTKFLSEFDIKTSGDYIKNLTFGKDVNVIHKTSSIFPLTKIVFESIEYPSPNNIEEYLKAKYGNYMSIPVDIGSPIHFAWRSGYDQIQALRTFLKNHDSNFNDNK